MAVRVRTFRNDHFIALNGGNTIRNPQCVIGQDVVDAATRARFTPSALVKCARTIVENQGSGQHVENRGVMGQANISEATYALVRNETSFSFFMPRGKVQAKGKGELEVYFVGHGRPQTTH